MAPSASRTRYKRQEPKLIGGGTLMESPRGCTASSCKESWSTNSQDNNEKDIVVTGCSTPKAQRFRIPEMSSCPPPPAPKKRRLNSSSVSNRSPIAFFVPPDIELFFLLAFQNIRQ